MANVESGKMMKEVVADALLAHFVKRPGGQKFCKVVDGQVAKGKRVAVMLGDLKYTELQEASEHDLNIYATFTGESEGVQYEIRCASRNTLGEVLLPYLMAL